MTEIPMKMWVLDVRDCSPTDCKSDAHIAGYGPKTTKAVFVRIEVPLYRGRNLNVPATIPLCAKCRKLVID